MDKRKVLFVCIHNSARSQMAEELLRKLAGDQFETVSAGIEPGVLNPVVVEVLSREEGIDIRGKKTRSVLELSRSGARFDYVIAVCDKEAAQRCPVFPGAAQNIRWSFPDPSGFTGTDQEKFQKVRDVKDQIKEKLAEWLKTRP